MKDIHMYLQNEEFLCLAAKTNKHSQEEWLPLWMHLYDTASVMDYLLTHRFVMSAEKYGLTTKQYRDICIFLSAIHDLGKATPAFQSMISESNPGILTRLSQSGLHDSFQFKVSDRSTYGRHDVLGGILFRLYGGSREHAVVIASHHGIMPERDYNAEDNQRILCHENLFWEKGTKNKWQKVQQELLRFASSLAGIENDSGLPVICKEVQMLLTGLIITADWLASNTSYFPLVRMDMTTEELEQLYPSRINAGLEKIQFPENWKVTDRWTTGDLLQTRFGFSSNEMQSVVQQLAGSGDAPPGLMIIEAPMGCGKTEASLAAAEIIAQRAGKSGLAFFLPSQATSNALFNRLKDWAETQTEGHKVAVQLAHASFMLNDEFNSITQLGDEEAGSPDLVTHQFFCGSKSFLLANFVVGTIDQLLLAGVRQRHVMLKHLGLSEKVVIIDECHAYDAYMNAYLDRVLEFLYLYDVPVVLLSATLPEQRRRELLQAYGKQKKKSVAFEQLEDGNRYPLISWKRGNQFGCSVVNATEQQKSIGILQARDSDVKSIVSNAIESGASIGIIVNTVQRAQQFARELSSDLNVEVMLYHAQYVLPDRVTKEKEILGKVGKYSVYDNRKGSVVVGTQVLEQSLDIDFDILITDLCPMDLLLQRIGRLHRHSFRIRPLGYEQGKCVVLNTDLNHLDEASEAVYGKYLLKKTVINLPGQLQIPNDIAPLVQMVYNDDIEQYRDLLLLDYEQYYKDRKTKQNKAESQFMLPHMANGVLFGKTIEGLMEKSNSITEDTARASVRDGDPSLEVIVLREIGEDCFEIVLEQNKNGSSFHNELLNVKFAKLIAEQKIRLPHKLSVPWNAEKLVEELRTESITKLNEIQKSPWLRNELFLILDRNSNKTVLGRYRLHYSWEYGLVTRDGGIEEHEEILLGE